MAEERGLRPRHDLDAVVANIELTLISVVQGVALYFLTDNSRTVLIEQKWASIPYVITGLLIILTVWARSVLHAFTVIRWPIEFGHNFFYITVTVIEATLFSQIGTPERWYPMSCILAAFFWVMFAYELRMYRLRRADSAGPVGSVLLDKLEREHRQSLFGWMPLLSLIWGAMAGCVWRWPDLFIARGWHVGLAIGQAAGLVIYLAVVWHFYLRISDEILAAYSEWNSPQK